VNARHAEAVRKFRDQVTKTRDMLHVLPEQQQRESGRVMNRLTVLVDELEAGEVENGASWMLDWKEACRAWDDTLELIRAHTSLGGRLRQRATSAVHKMQEMALR